jgi:hypothetical protein
MSNGFGCEAGWCGLLHTVVESNAFLLLLPLVVTSAFACEAGAIIKRWDCIKVGCVGLHLG